MTIGLKHPQPTSVPPLPPSVMRDLAGPRPNRQVETFVERASKDRFRLLGAWFAVLLLAIKFSATPEFIANYLGVNLYLLYILGAPAVAAMLLSQSWNYAGLLKPPLIWWFLFAGWLILAIPFSVFKAGSFGTVIPYMRVNFPLMLLAPMLILTWKECRRLGIGLAVACFLIVVYSRLIGGSGLAHQGRIELEGASSIGNANDLAASILATMPFALFLVLRPATNWFLRFGSILVVCAALYTTLHTGSRGALVALAVVGTMILFRSTAKQRLGLLSAGILAMVGAFALLPDATVQRLLSFSEESSSSSEEALMSKRSRMELLERAIELAVRNPIFGVGPGQFMVADDREAKSEGKARGAWHVTHNSFAEVASEGGLPALVFFSLGIGSSYWLVSRANRAARRLPQLKEVADLTYCYCLALVGYTVAVVFLSHGYAAYFPMFVGIAAALSACAWREIRAALAGAPSPQAAAAPSGPGAAQTAVLPSWFRPPRRHPRFAGR